MITKNGRPSLGLPADRYVLVTVLRTGFTLIYDKLHVAHFAVQLVTSLFQ